jgi:hypothetical protein
MRALILAATALVCAIVAAAAEDRCSGCGCKGGPGYRAPNGRCVGWADVGRICGSPPTQRWTPELTNANAGEAAAYGVKALELAPQPLSPSKR